MIQSAYNTTGFNISVKQIWQTLLDPKPWGFAVIHSGVALGISSVGLFMPTSINELGFSAGWCFLTFNELEASGSVIERTQLFSVIPYAFATVVLALTILPDRLNRKGIFLIATLSLRCIGYIVLLCDVPIVGKIAAACLAKAAYTLLSSWSRRGSFQI